MTLRAAFAAALILAAVVPAHGAFAAQIEVCFSPPLPGGCDPIRAIEDRDRFCAKINPGPGL